MSDPFDLLWPALVAVPGVLSGAVVDLNGTPVTVSVALTEPVEDVFGGAVAVANYRIEYLTADLPALRRGVSMQIDGRAFRTTVHGKTTGDGRFSVADLEAL